VASDNRWWIGRAERTLSEQIPAPTEAVRAFYVDLRNIIRVHPLVVSVTPTDRTESGDGYTQTYRVRDRIPLGPLTMDIGYTARVTVPGNGDVHTEARQFPRVQLIGTVSFDPSGDGTRLTERLLISAPRPLAAFTVGEAVEAHRAMLVGIREHFEGRSG
jgi:ligand-binding SRPBCC domain-containing protein